MVGVALVEISVVDLVEEDLLLLFGGSVTEVNNVGHYGYFLRIIEQVLGFICKDLRRYQGANILSASAKQRKLPYRPAHSTESTIFLLTLEFICVDNSELLRNLQLSIQKLRVCK